jgi:rhamnosyltransferase
MNATVIILTKNAGRNFFPLLQRLSCQKFDGDYEVLVIDSGSTDGTKEVAERFPVKLVEIDPKEFHHGKTRNLGAELSNDGILVYITQDALPLHDDWLQELTNELKEPDVAMVIGRQIPWQDAKPPEKFFYYFYFPEHRIEVVGNASDYYRDNMFISNVNSAIKREVWQRFKFSEGVVLGEDKEFGKRVLLAGGKIIYRPSAVVYHSHDFDLRSIFRRSIDSGMAMSQGINVPRSKNWVIQRVGYFVKEIRYIVAHGGWLKWLPYSIAYETTKVSGTALGWIRRKLL